MQSHDERRQSQRHGEHAEARLQDENYKERAGEAQSDHPPGGTCRGKHGQDDDDEPQGAGRVAVNHLAPCLAHVGRRMWEVQLRRRIVVDAKWRRRAVAPGPVRAA